MHIEKESGTLVKTDFETWTDGSCNNRMELLAVISTANWIPANSSVTIYSDSKYAINILSGRWRAKTNTDLVRLYDTVASRLKEIRFKWVKWHSGIEWNEYADGPAGSETARIAKEHNIPLYNANNSPKYLR